MGSFVNFRDAFEYGQGKSQETSNAFKFPCHWVPRDSAFFMLRSGVRDVRDVRDVRPRSCEAAKRGIIILIFAAAERIPPFPLSGRWLEFDADKF